MKTIKPAKFPCKLLYFYLPWLSFHADSKSISKLTESLKCLQLWNMNLISDWLCSHLLSHKGNHFNLSQTRFMEIRHKILKILCLMEIISLMPKKANYHTLGNNKAFQHFFKHFKLHATFLKDRLLFLC